MRNIKMVMTVLLAVMLMVVTACSSNNGGNNNQPTAAPATSAPTAAPTEEPVKEREIDMNGETLKIMHWMPGPSEETPEGALILERWREAEEKYNVKIEYVQVPWGEPVNIVTNAALTGEATADFVPLDLYFAIPAVNNGLFMPVDDFFDFDDPKWPKNMKQYGNINGKMYGITADKPNTSGIYYNKTMFEREGIEDPHDLIAKGEWTWDKFLEIAQKLTKDTDGDGVIDQYGITNYTTGLARMFIYSNGTELIKRDDSGKYYYNYEDPKVVEAYRFFSDLYNVHKVVAPPQDHAGTQTIFNSGKAGMVTGETWEGSQRVDMTDKQGFVYFPKGPNGEVWQGSVENYVQYYMPATVKRAEEKAYIWDQIQLWDRQDQRIREEAEKQLLAEEKDIALMEEAPDFAQPVFIPGVVAQPAVPIAIENKSVETALEENKQIAQDAIDQFMNGVKVTQ